MGVSENGLGDWAKSGAKAGTGTGIAMKGTV